MVSKYKRKNKKTLSMFSIQDLQLYKDTRYVYIMSRLKANYLCEKRMPIRAFHTRCLVRTFAARQHRVRT